MHSQCDDPLALIQREREQERATRRRAERRDLAATFMAAEITRSGLAFGLGESPVACAGRALEMADALLVAMAAGAQEYPHAPL